LGAFILDLLVNVIIIGGMLLYYRWPLTARILWTPLFVVELLIAAPGVCLILAALNVHGELRFDDLLGQ
jgi:ABC-type polysaccharide/polyol phosphate export permease